MPTISSQQAKPAYFLLRTSSGAPGDSASKELQQACMPLGMSKNGVHFPPSAFSLLGMSTLNTPRSLDHVYLIMHESASTLVCYIHLKLEGAASTVGWSVGLNSCNSPTGAGTDQRQHCNHGPAHCRKGSRSRLWTVLTLMPSFLLLCYMCDISLAIIHI